LFESKVVAQSVVAVFSVCDVVFVYYYLVLTVTFQTFKPVRSHIQQVRLHDTVQLGPLNFKLPDDFNLKVVDHALNLVLHRFEVVIHDLVKFGFVQFKLRFFNFYFSEKGLYRLVTLSAKDCFVNHRQFWGFKQFLRYFILKLHTVHSVFMAGTVLVNFPRTFPQVINQNIARIAGPDRNRMAVLAESNTGEGFPRLYLLHQLFFVDVEEANGRIRTDAAQKQFVQRTKRERLHILFRER
jgi:hypothetical protein